MARSRNGAQTRPSGGGLQLALGRRLVAVAALVSAIIIAEVGSTCDSDEVGSSLYIAVSCSSLEVVVYNVGLSSTPFNLYFTCYAYNTTTRTTDVPESTEVLSMSTHWNQTINIEEMYGLLDIYADGTQCDFYGCYTHFSDYLLQNESCIINHECSNNSRCIQTFCNNTVGGFECSCHQGYQLDENGTACIDIDECTLEMDDCAHNCTNTIGGFNCSCRDGYELVHGRNCGDIDECIRGLDDCHLKAYCTNTAGSFLCECQPSFTGDGKNCTESMYIAVNCTTLEVVVYRVGSAYTPFNLYFTCYAYNTTTMTTGAPETTRVLKMSPSWNRILYIDGLLSTYADGTRCDFHGDYRQYTSYAPFRSDYLLRNESCILDHNECLVNNSGCLQLCNNTVGSFECYCHHGHQLSEDGFTCSDIDECAMAKDDCAHNCSNTIGGFNCSCRDGYELEEDGKNCTDIDECNTGRDNCDFNINCTNIPGSFRCGCVSNFNGNGQNCAVILRRQVLPGVISGILVFCGIAVGLGGSLLFFKTRQKQRTKLDQEYLFLYGHYLSDNVLLPSKLPVDIDVTQKQLLTALSRSSSQNTILDSICPNHVVRDEANAVTRASSDDLFQQRDASNNTEAHAELPSVTTDATQEREKGAFYTQLTASPCGEHDAKEQVSSFQSQPNSVDITQPHLIFTNAVASSEGDDKVSKHVIPLEEHAIPLEEDINCHVDPCHGDTSGYLPNSTVGLGDRQGSVTALSSESCDLPIVLDGDNLLCQDVATGVSLLQSELTRTSASLSLHTLEEHKITRDLRDLEGYIADDDDEVIPVESVVYTEDSCRHPYPMVAFRHNSDEGYTVYAIEDR